jgi:hypothetical protein
MHGWSATAAAALMLAGVAQVTRVPARIAIPYEDARLVVESVREDLLPADLRAAKPSDRAGLWPDWVARRDRAIRARLERGDRDSVVNFLLFGSSFTKQARASGDDLAALEETPGRVTPVLAARLDDLARAVGSPGTNERLQIARALLEQAGIDPTAPSGRSKARGYLEDSLRLGPTELSIYAQQIEAARRQGVSGPALAGSVFRDRGLSSDTSIVVNAALDRALSVIKGQGHFDAATGADSHSASSGMRRVAIVGPGLDFTDKHDGHDFYPLQTIQPFAVVDSLVRHELARGDALRVTTLDLSPRIVQHIEQARRRAGQGQGYVVNLPRNRDLPWGADLAAYWEGFGARIGGGVAGAKVPPGIGNVTVRSIRIRPAVVRLIEPADVNIVVERLDVPPDERFDLVVATDVLVYYDVFEQSLALANIASMLRSGGLLLTNNPLFELPGIPLERAGAIDVVHMTMPIAGDIRDRVTWYRRR